MPMDMSNQAMMAKALREKAPEAEPAEDLPEGCCCGECPRMEECMAAGGGPKTPEDAGGMGNGMGMMGGGMGGMKGGAA